MTARQRVGKRRRVRRKPNVRITAEVPRREKKKLLEGREQSERGMGC